MRSKIAPAIAFLAFSLLSSLAPVLAAQSPALRLDPEARQRRVSMQVARLAATLGLNDQQKAGVRPLIESRVDQVRSLRLDEQLTPEQKETKLQTIQASYERDLRALLSPDQLKKLTEAKDRNQKAHQQDMAQRRKGRVPVKDIE